MLGLESRLRLQKVVLSLSVRVLVKPGGLLVAIRVRVHARGLVLESSWLCVLIVEETGRHGLLRVDRIAEPVHGTLLLVALVEASRLHLGGSIIKERVCITLLQFTFSQFFLLLTKFDGLGKVFIIVDARFLSTSSSLFFGFSLAGFDCKSVFGIVLVIGVTSPSLPAWWFVAKAPWLIIEPADPCLPELAIGSFAPQSVFVQDQCRKFLRRNTNYNRISTSSSRLAPSATLTVLAHVTSLLVDILEFAQGFNNVDIFARPRHY